MCIFIFLCVCVWFSFLLIIEFCYSSIVKELTQIALKIQEWKLNKNRSNLRCIQMRVWTCDRPILWTAPYTVNVTFKKFCGLIRGYNGINIELTFKLRLAKHFLKYFVCSTSFFPSLIGQSRCCGLLFRLQKKSKRGREQVIGGYVSRIYTHQETNTPYDLQHFGRLLFCFYRNIRILNKRST